MITSSSSGVPSGVVPGSRIPVAKHRQASPERFPNHFQQQHSQPHHISRLPKYQCSTNSQHDSAVSSSGGSSGGSGESEGESSANIFKRRKDSSGSTTCLHGASGK